MNIQQKLALTYITLLSIGVVVISAYAILSIRTFLLDEAISQFEEDARTFAESLEEEDDFTDLFIKTTFTADLTGYQIALFDSTGTVLVNAPVDAPEFQDSRAFLNDDLLSELDRDEQVILNDEDLDQVLSFHKINRQITEIRYLRISKSKQDLYAAAASIRHLIYGAMIGSILVVIIVSFIFARYLGKPIKQLEEAALDIADGNLDREIDLARKDEFGSLAKSLNSMAAKLKDDYEKLKTLNEKQNEFFADIAHEVRNPLHTISGAMEMLQLDGLSDEKKAQYLHTAQKQVDRVVRLFQDIKSLQRYDMDEGYIHKSTFIIEDLVTEVVKTYQPIASDKNLALIFDKTGEHLVFADYEKMEQVLDNLVSNAIKYTHDGQIQVKCTPQEGKVNVQIIDSGIGIGAEHLDRLFDRFYRTDKARSRDKGGTGLGLAVVKGILNAHNVEILVESTPEVGSTFYFSLPIEEKA
ncbi:MAG: HAMP domain-containing histidine kinase [Balneolaceae bacterium]|nr:HAMP domain-containing histidine kinase [Balneolaceae bacterium]